MVNESTLDAFMRRLATLGCEADDTIRARDHRYFTRRSLGAARDILIACRHWNSSTPIVPQTSLELLPHARLAGYGFGGGYFLVANGVGIVVDPGFGFVNLLYTAYGYTVCDIDAIFVTHDHPDHWADLPTILALKYTAATKYRGKTPSREPFVYVNRTLAPLRDFLAPSGLPGGTIARGQAVPLPTQQGDEAVIVTGVKAFHSERLVPTRNSPDAIGLHVRIVGADCERPGLRNVAIASDTQFPSPRKNEDTIPEFTQQDEEDFLAEYESGCPGMSDETCKRGDRRIDVLAFHIGSVEPQIADMMKGKTGKEAAKELRENVFYKGYHLGFAGCLRMLDAVFRSDESLKVAILTEFGEELRGHRVDLARALQSLTNANPTSGAENVTVVPADIGMALQLTWAKGAEKPGASVRCSRCLRMAETRTCSDPELDLMAPEFFHPISDMDVFEDPDTGLVQYCCHW